MLLDIKPNPAAAYSLLHKGILCLAAIEANGIRIDTDYIEAVSPKVEAEIKELTDKIYATAEWKKWREHFGPKANLDSNEELAVVVWDLLGNECPAYTDTGKRKTDAEALSTVDTPFVNLLVLRSQLAKANSTFLAGIKTHITPEGMLHPVFNLHTTKTYRSSSDSPNFQNMPVRNKKVANLIRSAFIPRAGHVIVEHDFSGVEVRVAACYHQDPVMLEYITDTTKDMHRDVACQIYFLDSDWMKKKGKAIRNTAKNKYVFPEFYGSCWFQVAADLWKDIGKYKLTGPEGDSLYEHLKRNGISELGERPPQGSKEKLPPKGTFMRHVADIEKDFWERRFRVYNDWRIKWFDRFKEKGHFNTLTGFTIGGNLIRNQVNNYAVQGSAFHCLLWSVTRINNILKKRGMKSCIVGQIHDSCVADVHIDELDDYMKIARKVMTQDVMREFPWLIVPLAAECDISPPNGSWGDKRAVDHNADDTYSTEWKDKKFTFGTTTELVQFLRETHSESTGLPLNRKKLKTRIV